MRLTDWMCEEIDAALTAHPAGKGVDYDVAVVQVQGPAGPTPFAQFLYATASPVLGGPPLMVSAMMPLENALQGTTVRQQVSAALEALAENASEAIGRPAPPPSTGLILP